ncbi:putative surface protein with fasciclin (FAS1) repeats [Filimonas zeae]|uniref:fasciclin domain-containing protein n=1 Tax=Filimonas zeae TaxID=1737353 RepID=UPI001669F0C7|nr:fasciclin domain-containing protein [Filimonas zeae]MDR6338086.1 putative surface protein with fasciclin (FAS1) repeats [Filimonas zeae]
MFLLFQRRSAACLILLLPLLFAVILPGCKKGYDKYWSNENPKTGFIYDKVKADTSFSIFAAGLERAGLVKFVNVTGLYTVFAPTNTAFRQFFQAKAYSTIADVPVDDLFAMLSYHIANNMWYYYDFSTRFATTQKTAYITRNNKFLNIDVSVADRFTVNGIAVIKSLQDMDAENGVIHGIGEVLIPLPNAEQVLSKDAALAGNVFYQLMQNLASKQYDRFNSYDADRDGKIDSVFYTTYPLLQNVNTSLEYIPNSAPESQGGDPVFTTFLIPDNTVMNTLLAPVLPGFENDIKKLPRLYVQALLESYFIKDSIILSDELMARPRALMAINGELVPALTADKLVLADKRASNGVVHVLNTTFPVPDKLKSAIGTIMTNPEFTDFVEAIQSANLTVAYTATSKAATFLAPTNAAFEAAGINVRKKTLNGVQLTDAQFINIVKQHVISSNLARTALTGSKNTDYASNPLVFTTANNVVSVKSGSGITAEVGTEYRGATGVTNGYVYRVEQVLMPASY